MAASRPAGSGCDHAGAWPRAGRARLLQVSLAGVVYAVVLALSIRALIAPPRLALTLGSPTTGVPRAAWVLPGGSLWDQGVRPGDEVLTLAGRPPRTSGGRAGERVTMRIDGAVRTFAARDLPRQHRSWPLLLISPWFLLLATLIYLRASPPALAGAAYALLAGAAYALALAPAALADQQGALVAEFATVPLFAAAFARFFLVFPRPIAGRTLQRLLLVPPLLVGGAGILAQRWPAIYAPAEAARLLIVLLYLLLGTAAAARAFARERDRAVRRGLAVLGAGTLASVAPFLAFYLLPTVLGRPAPMRAEEAVLGLAILPASLAFAILRHAALPVALLQRWLVHAALWAALVAAYAAPVYVVRGQHGAPLAEAGLPATVALVALVGTSFRWVHDRLWRRIDGLIFKDTYNYRASLQALSRDLSVAEGLSNLGIVLPARLRDLLHLDFVLLLVREGQDLRPFGSAGAFPPSLLPALADAARGARGEMRLVPAVDDAVPVMLAPLRTRDAVAGWLCLGPKLSGEPFRAEDEALLLTLSGHLGALVRNAQLVDELRGKVEALDALNDRLQHVREEERAQLAAELHDEPLQTAVHLQRQLAERADAEARDHAAIGGALVAQLRAICTALRPSTLDDLGLAASLELLIQEAGARGDIAIVLDAEADFADLALPPAVELVLYRATQEAIGNCLRHADAREIRVVLRRAGGCIRLRVSDDGAGFAVPPHLERLALAGHLGLAGLHGRVGRAGGTLTVASAPGAGTAVAIALPLPPAAP